MVNSGDGTVYCNESGSAGVKNQANILHFLFGIHYSTDW
mgnify:CR=1 FL=1